MPAKTPAFEGLTEAREIIQNGLLSTMDTADFTFLQNQFWYVPVFMYGAEKKGFAEQRVMRGQDPIGRGHTRDGYFSMQLFNKEPVVFCETKNPDTGRLYGELYLVTPSHLAELDQRYMVGTYGRRFLRLVRWYDYEKKDQKEKTFYTSRVYMYTAYAPEWINKRKDMVPARRFQSSADASVMYYTFTQADDQSLRQSMGRRT